MNILFYALLALTALVFVLYWYANYATQTGFAKDDNHNKIPDTWEKYAVLFKIKNFVILILGILVGYLFTFTSF